MGRRFRGDLQGLENWSEKENILDEFKRMNIKINFDCYLNNDNYEKLAKMRFERKLKAGIVNRYLWGKVNRNKYPLVVNNSEWIIKHLYSIYNYNPLQRILYPFALFRTKNIFKKM